MWVIAALWSTVVFCDEKPLLPAQAKQHVGKEVTVEMTVVASKKSVKRKLLFLDSLENHYDPDNLGVTLSESIEADLARKHETADVAEFFRKKTIRVQGVVITRDNHTYINVDNVDKLTLVEKQP